jgi:hypothetical protein
MGFPTAALRGGTGMSDCAARPRWAAHRRVLSRPDSRAIEAPCVLALHSPIPPARRASFRFDLLATRFPTGRFRWMDPRSRGGTPGGDHSRDPGRLFARLPREGAADPPRTPRSIARELRFPVAAKGGSGVRIASAS